MTSILVNPVLYLSTFNFYLNSIVPNNFIFIFPLHFKFCNSHISKAKQFEIKDQKFQVLNVSFNLFQEFLA
jgi:hypothetical protein